MKNQLVSVLIGLCSVTAVHAQTAMPTSDQTAVNSPRTATPATPPTTTVAAPMTNPAPNDGSNYARKIAQAKGIQLTPQVLAQLQQEYRQLNAEDGGTRTGAAPDANGSGARASARARVAGRRRNTNRPTATSRTGAGTSATSRTGSTASSAVTPAGGGDDIVRGKKKESLAEEN